jgi:hypothetical protein
MIHKWQSSELTLLYKIIARLRVISHFQVFCMELPIFLREHFNGMYRTDVYFIRDQCHKTFLAIIGSDWLILQAISCDFVTFSRAILRMILQANSHVILWAILLAILRAILRANLRAISQADVMSDFAGKFRLFYWQFFWQFSGRFCGHFCKKTSLM